MPQPPPSPTGRTARVVRLPPAARPAPPRPGAAPQRGAPLPWLALLGLVVVVGAGQFADGFYAIGAWGVIGLAAAVLTIALLLMTSVRLSGPLRLTLACTAALLVLAALSMTWAASTDRAWTEVNRLGTYALLLLVAALVAGRPVRRRALFGGAAAAAALLPAYVLAAGISGRGAGLFVDFRLYEPVGYTNAMAGLLLMMLWCFAATAAAARGPVLAGAAAGAATTCAGLLVLTQSRAVVPALVVSAVVALIVSPHRTRLAWLLLLAAGATAAGLQWTLEVYASRVPDGVPAGATVREAMVAVAACSLLVAGLWAPARVLAARVRSPAARAVAVAVPVLVVLAAGGVVAAASPVERAREQWQAFRTLSVDTTSTNRFSDVGGYRYDLWRIALEEFRAHPVAGVGAGNYVVDYLRLRRNPQYVRQPHSIELQLLAELGIAGALAGLLVLAGVGWGVLAAARRLRDAPEPVDAAIGVAAAGVLAAWLVHTSVDWLYNLPSVTAFAIVFAGLVLAAPEGGPAAAPRRPRAPLPTALGVVVVALLAASIGRQYLGDVHLRRAQQALPRDVASAVRNADHAIAFNPGNVDAHFARAAALARRNDYAGSRRSLMAAAAAERFNYVPWALMGDLAVRAGDREQARRDYARASRLNPFDPGLRALAEEG